MPKLKNIKKKDTSNRYTGYDDTRHKNENNCTDKTSQSNNLFITTYLYFQNYHFFLLF